MTGVEACSKIMQEVSKTIIGKEDIIKNVMTAIVAKGHILLEDVPGVGKTTLALAFSKAMNLEYKRMQFTPDVMPSDVTGYTIFNKEKGTFEFKEGVIMCNLFLADEINRTSSKTQSALLEAMEEGKVTVDGKTQLLHPPFIVIATQNPVGSIGTSMLPESQLDRFMIRISMGYPSVDSEVDMLKSKNEESDVCESIEAVISSEDLKVIQKEASEVFIHDAIYKFIVGIVSATRNNQNISLGVSPRGTIAIANAAKALAYINGRDYVVPDDVKEVLTPIINHRIILSSSARSMQLGIDDVITQILRSVEIKKV